MGGNLPVGSKGRKRQEAGVMRSDSESGRSLWEVGSGGRTGREGVVPKSRRRRLTFSLAFPMQTFGVF